VGVETVGLGRRYGQTWALRECNLQLPAERVIGLVGPNGAGKTTLMHMLVGLLRPTTGRALVLGAPPGRPDVRARTGFVAQDKPLYRTFTVAETLQLGGWLNPAFDEPTARARLDRLDIPLDRRVGKLSGGQHAQVALALALGKRPDLLVLDEPVSSLDPLARRDFLRMVMEDFAESGRTVLFSSHLIADLERTCDYLVLLSSARVQLCGDVDELRASHLMLSGPRDHAVAVANAHTVVQVEYAERQVSMLVRAHGPIHDPTFTVRSATLEEIVLGYMSAPDIGATRPLRLAANHTEAPSVAPLPRSGPAAGGGA
jgi:ABC-2 type transport system ATP-binding protein